MFLCLHPLPPSPSLELGCLIPLIYLGTPRQYIIFNVQRGPPTTPLTMFGLWGVGSGGTAFDDLVYGFMMDRTMSPAFLSSWPFCIKWEQWNSLYRPLNPPKLGFEDGMYRGKQFLPYFQVKRAGRGRKKTKGRPPWNWQLVLDILYCRLWAWKKENLISALPYIQITQGQSSHEID